jgi:hypothetical protein
VVQGLAVLETAADLLDRGDQFPHLPVGQVSLCEAEPRKAHQWVGTCVLALNSTWRRFARDQ